MYLWGVRYARFGRMTLPTLLPSGQCTACMQAPGCRFGRLPAHRQIPRHHAAFGSSHSPPKAIRQTPTCMHAARHNRASAACSPAGGRTLRQGTALYCSASVGRRASHANRTPIRAAASPQDSGAEETEAVIVGGGLAGLGAALALQKAGKKSPAIVRSNSNRDQNALLNPA